METNLFINNQFVKSTSGKVLTIENPYDHSVVTSSVSCATAADVDEAVRAASTAFPSWRNTRPSTRAQLMNRLADLVDEHTAALGQLETAAMGAPAFIAQHTVGELARSLRYYAGWTDKIAGHVFVDAAEGVHRMVSYEPLGVCAGVAAWNATFMFLAWKMAPALAAGNTFIFKASEKSPLGVLALGELVISAGFPPGVINLFGGAGDAGQRLAEHPDIAKISFTGSTATGRLVQAAAAHSNLKRCTLELGGKSAAIVFADAYLENALDQMSRGFLINTTQVCAATTRLLLHESLADSFLAQLKVKFEDVLGATGDPSQQGTFMGPVADEMQFLRILAILNKAREDGVQILTGGGRHGSRGYFIQPTILVNPPLDSDVYRNEIFGPVLCVCTFQTEDEAIRMANDSLYGLGAAVYTADVGRALRVSSALHVGSVGVNRPVVPDLRVPFGGCKGSGYGRESGKAGLMAYLDSKTVSIDVNAVKSA